MIANDVLHLSELTKLSNGGVAHANRFYVLHLSELTKLSNYIPAMQNF